MKTRKIHITNPTPKAMEFITQIRKAKEQRKAKNVAEIKNRMFVSK